MAGLRLTVIRHAKSSWSHPELSDHDRPLNKRGRRDAPRMGERLRDRGFDADAILTSTAVRARLTAEAIAEACGLADRVRAKHALYHAEPEAVIELVDAVASERALQHVAVVGHNPGFTELVVWLTGADLDNLPTCGVATIDLDGERFADPRGGRGRLALLETPKNDPERSAER